jgi:hypothetical protein
MSTSSSPRGPAPKPASQHRRRTEPESYGAAEPTVSGQGDEQPPLGFEAHELVVGLWAALGSSVEGRFYLAADWQRARWGLWYANAVMTAGQVPSVNQWTAVQRGLDELLVSPAVKRRAGIELWRRGVDADVVAVVRDQARVAQQLEVLARG